MNKKLYVGNLPYNVTETDLRDAFGAHGAIESVRIITDKLSGRSKGFAFVEMATEEEAQKAIDGLNGKDLSGRALTVSEARPEQPRAPRGGGLGGGGGYDDRHDSGAGGRRNFRDRDGGSGRGGGGGFNDDNFGNR